MCLKKKCLGTKILFGVHAVSDEKEMGKRIKPEASGQQDKVEVTYTRA